MWAVDCGGFFFLYSFLSLGVVVRLLGRGCTTTVPKKVSFMLVHIC